MEITKRTKSLGTLVIRPVEKKLAKSMIIENHYSHKWNDSFGIFRENSAKCLGAAVFGRMMNSNSFRMISEELEKDDIVELNRLWIDDCLGHNAESLFIGTCFKIIRSEYPHIKAIQSFADGRLGCGTIYKATNFKYFGFHRTLFYENKVTGEITHEVIMNNAKHTGIVRMNRQWCEGNLKPFLVNTYRYIYPLKKICFKLKEKPYPEYSIGKEYITEYRHNIRLIYRALCVAYISGLSNDFEIIKNWILNNQTNEEIQSYMKLALSNEYILQRAERNNLQHKVKELYSLFEK
ncbi:MAG: hypothetical protein NC205_08485 [Prevotella sp.]|nr:hypothetical protein [Alistipes senegalensis]MCM1358621.1 hypothetical protein [Prevotella sp.]MCM1474283.1 hypothetical protein [Muribaculaceae bacterium]